MKHLHGITVLVLGLGESGLAMARWCARWGASVRVWDSREAPPHAASLAEQVSDAQLATGELNDMLLDGVQLVLKSPGLAPTDERIAAPLNRAAERGVLVQGELELFAHALADLKAERGYAPKVLAITGTNGKTTTTAMTALLVGRTGRRVAMAGNIGPTMLDTLAAALDLEPAPVPDEAVSGREVPLLVDSDAFAAAPAESSEELSNGDVVEDNPALADSDAFAAAPVESTEEDLSSQELASVQEEGNRDVEAGELDKPVTDSGDEPLTELIPPPPAEPVFEHLPDVWVLELSSFQLDEAKGFEPSAAVVLNVTEDHLDWHGSMAAYAAAKARIYGKNAVMVVNRDDPAVEKMVPAPVPGKGRFAKPVERRVVRFGLDAPQRPGDFGLITENGMAWLVRAMEADETLKRGKRGAAVVEDDLHIQRLMPADALRVRGRHNAANALAALSLATAVGCPLAPMLHGLREYTGEPHRVEFIATVNGVDAFDDSKGTNVGATVAAINGLGADRAPARLVVILGGDGKGQNFEPLREPVQRHARAVVTLGRDAALIEAALADAGVPLQRQDTLQAAVRCAMERAHAGDAVLLSPACASLDMFRNYVHRAEVFVAEVHALAAEHGEVHL
jgi:UDP-N-acetylmuramoylalanine--D-glutamate ligase